MRRPAVRVLGGAALMAGALALPADAWASPAGGAPQDEVESPAPEATPTLEEPPAPAEPAGLPPPEDPRSLPPEGPEPASAPVAAPAEAAAPEAEPAVAPGRHFVFANTYGFTFGVSPLPSFEAMFFFGGALRQREEGRRRWALGYQPTISFGLADRYFVGILTLRHHVAAHSFGGKRERLIASVSAGVANVALLEPAIAEAEGRMGYLFGRRRDRSRMVGVVGGLLRLGWHFRTLERVPMPQVGVFVGMLLR